MKENTRYVLEVMMVSSPSRHSLLREICPGVPRSMMAGASSNTVSCACNTRLSVGEKGHGRELNCALHLQLLDWMALAAKGVKLRNTRPGPT